MPRLTLLLQLSYYLSVLYFSVGKLVSSSLPSTAAPVWWVKDLSLTVDDKEVLTNGEWLNDKHIVAAQKLLKIQYPFIDGLQSPNLGSILVFKVMTGEGVQIIHHMSHWTCLSTIGCQANEINVYDSLYSRLSVAARKQACSMLDTTEAMLTIRMQEVQSQSGGADCGVFAIAFAVSLCQGKDPCSISLEQPLMRQHLTECLSNQFMTPFPECM